VLSRVEPLIQHFRIAGQQPAEPARLPMEAAMAGALFATQTTMDTVRCAVGLLFADPEETLE